MNCIRLAAAIPKESRAEALHHTSDIISLKHVQVRTSNTSTFVFCVLSLIMYVVVPSIHLSRVAQVKVGQIRWRFKL